MTDILRFEDVGLRYGLGPEILQIFPLDFKRDLSISLMGPSGAGKSSLLKLMYLALKPTRGLIHIFGEEISTINRKRAPSLRRNIGVVYQEFRLIPHISAFDNVPFPLE